ncbi:SWIM-type domain-containing protein [Heracleum sosnowskyi]|uniref:SWIM-type domain-containing protein n=1 Tax=Heracleum sosnowskyi TaxID=360622 RepID=A0AAD8N9D7_9APIA|nr:SWIM-type domain-containing protein [Heracleum sosnowskyi]
MDSIPIILQHRGHWDDNSSYVNFQVCGLLIPTNCNYSNLVGMICNELNLQPQLTSMKIEYQVKDGYSPFNIVDDLQLMFYLELKKREEDFTMYPLCLTTEIKNIQPRSFSTWSEITTDDLCVEVAHTEDVASNLFYENMVEGSKEIVADYMDYAELVCGQMVDISTEATSEDEIYKDKETLQIVLSHYALNNNFQYIVQKSCKKEYLVACIDKNFKWMLRASRNGKTNQFIIRRFIDTHTCALEIRFKSQRQATTSIIADVIKHKFTNIKTSYSFADIIRDMKHDHNVQVKYIKAWRSKEKALEMVRGNATESYIELYLYLYMLEITNPGSIIELKLNDNRCFLYVFVAFNASIKGWTHCIPIVVAGTFLKSAYGGTLLVTATQDAGGKTFPLAFCVVDSENDESCEWFFIKFRQSYGIREGMTIVSDRHERIIKGASKVYPEVPHVFFIFHLLSNIKSKFKKNSKKIKDAFFSAANAYIVKKFEYHMKELDKVDRRVQLFLQEVGYEKWAKRIANLVQKWSYSNRNTANATSTRLTTKFEEILKKNYLYSVDLTVHPTNHILF